MQSGPFGHSYHIQYHYSMVLVKWRGCKCIKALVVGAIQPQGKVVLPFVQASDRETLHGFIEQYTDDDTTAYFTDEYVACDGTKYEDTRDETVKPLYR